MITRTAKKYNVANPLNEFGSSNQEHQKPTKTDANAPSPLPSFAPNASSNPFGNPGVVSGAAGQNDRSSLSTGGGNIPSAQAQPAFGSVSATTSSPFSAIPKLGGSSSAPSPSPFAPSSSIPFGSHAGSLSSKSPFGSQAGGQSSASPFGSQPDPGLSSTTPFGTESFTPFGSPGPSTIQSGVQPQQLFNGKPARELLIQFYQEMNPSKLSKVDEVLQKYKGKEEDMFRKIAHQVSSFLHSAALDLATSCLDALKHVFRPFGSQYKVDPSKFGLSNAAPASFGPTTPVPAFGQSSSIGGVSSPFSQGGRGFGQPSALGGGTANSFASAGSSGGPTFGSGASAGFGAASFGSLAQSSPSTFGAPSIGFVGGAAGGLGSPTTGFGSPFGAPRR